VARLFISHSSANNAAALALRDWLYEQGFRNDVFLDIDPERGLVPGMQWQQALKAAADRCEAVLFLVSPAWLNSKWCLAEFLLAKSLHKCIFGLIIEPVPMERLPSEMTTEWQLCELAGEDRFRTFEVDVGAQPQKVAFRETGLELLRRGLQRAGLDAHSFPWPPPDERNRPPYPGLRALEPQDAAIFFGRDAMIVRGLDRIRGLIEGGVEKLLVVLGSSGSGKSSFLRAGLWPRLARDDVSFLPLPPIRPQSAVMSGTSGVAVALAGAFERLGEPRPPGRIKAALAEGGLARLLDELSAAARRRLVSLDETQADPAIILSIDQAEELFNPEGADEAGAFLAQLATILAPDASARRILVLATMRSDRYELLQSEPHLLAVKQDLFNLPPIAPSEFKSVIEGPARRVVEAGGRLTIDPALTEQLVADAQGADALPLLAFTLERLYADFGGDGDLTLAEYQKVGGVQGSIEAAIASALAEPGRSPAIPATKDAQLASMRSAFIPWLARIDPDSGAPMRRVARFDEIPEGSRAIVERLVAARLLVADRRTGIDVIEVAHESLLRQWPALTGWIEADAEDLKVIEVVERAAAEWVRNNRHEAWLDHRAERLSAADRLALRDDFRKRLGAEGADYLAACRAREEAERKAKDEALAREQTRLAEVAAAQARTARLQRSARFMLAAMALVVVAGLAAGWWQRQVNLAQGIELEHGRINLLAGLSSVERLRGNPDGALRLAAFAARLDQKSKRASAATSPALAALAAAVSQVGWRFSLSRHDDIVTYAAFSADGTRIVTASWDKTARIWNAKTGEEIAVLHAGEGALMSAVFSPDGSKIVVGSWDNTARVLDVRSGRELVVFKGHQAGAWNASFSPDGKRVVTASWDKTARVWDVATGKQLMVLSGHSKEVHTARYNPSGTRIVTASEDHTARIWDAETGKPLVTLEGHDQQVMSAAFSPDGASVVTGSFDNTARIWDANTGKEKMVLRGHEGRVSAASFSADGAWIVTSSMDRTARIWDAATGKELTVLRGHEDQVTSASISPDRALIVTSSRDRTVRVWDSKGGKQIAVLEGHRGGVMSATFSPDGSKILTSSNDSTARIWDASPRNDGTFVLAGEPRILRGHTGRVPSAAFNADASLIVTAATDKTARIWDAKSGKEIAVLQGHEGPVVFASFSPDGTKIVTASEDKTARIWDVKTAKELLVLRGHQDRVYSAVFSPDGRNVLTASWDKNAFIWDAETGEKIGVLAGHESPVHSATYSPDGRRIVTASWDTTAWIWDTATRHQIAILRGHEAGVISARFSPDGSRIVTASEDKTVRIWEAATAKEITVLRGHEDEVWFASFSPDGLRVVSGSVDRTARVWDARYAMMPLTELLDAVCTRMLGRLTRLTREEMRLAGYPESAQVIDVCDGSQ
jgi:WD40 repeat protein